MTTEKNDAPWTFRPSDDVLAIYEVMRRQDPDIDKTALINESILLRGAEAATSILLGQKALIESKLDTIKNLRTSGQRGADRLNSKPLSELQKMVKTSADQADAHRQR